MSTIQDITAQVRQVLIETNDGLSRHELYSRFVNECNQLQLSEDDFYKTVLKAAHKSIDWATVEEEYKKRQALQQATAQEQTEKDEAIANAPIFIDRLINLSFDTGIVKADALHKIFDKSVSLNQSSNALALRINERLVQDSYRPFPQANLDAVTLKEILLSTDWYSLDHYPKPDTNGPKRRFNPLVGIIGGVLLIGAIVYGLTRGNDKPAEPITIVPPVEAKKDSPAPYIPPPTDTTKPVVTAPTTPVTDSPSVKPAVAPATEETSTALTDDEVSDISNGLNTFYTADNNEAIDEMLGYFIFPVDRYYGSTTVYADSLEAMFKTAFNRKLLSHSITVDWGKTTIAKTTTGYLVSLSAVYKKVLQKKPDTEETMDLRITIKMNKDKKITSIYAS
jgi:hypothetical protein